MYWEHKLWIRLFLCSVCRLGPPLPAGTVFASSLNCVAFFIKKNKKNDASFLPHRKSHQIISLKPGYLVFRVRSIMTVWSFQIRVNIRNQSSEDEIYCIRDGSFPNYLNRKSTNVPSVLVLVLVLVQVHYIQYKVESTEEIRKQVEKMKVLQNPG